MGRSHFEFHAVSFSCLILTVLLKSQFPTRAIYHLQFSFQVSLLTHTNPSSLYRAIFDISICYSITKYRNIDIEIHSNKLDMLQLLTNNHKWKPETTLILLPLVVGCIKMWDFFCYIVNFQCDCLFILLLTQMLVWVCSYEFVCSVCISGIGKN